MDTKFEGLLEDMVSTLFFAVLGCIFIGAAIGWVLNIIKLLGGMDADVAMTTTEAVIRVAGILVPFVGAITGYF